MIPFIASVLGPSIGGVIYEGLGWRWAFWLTTIIASPLQLTFFITYRETYRVRILEVNASQLRRKTGNLHLRSKYAYGKDDEPKPVLIWKMVLRPLKLLFLSPVVLLTEIVCTVGMRVVYVIITLPSEIYDERYHFSKSTIGLAYWGLGMYSLNLVESTTLFNTCQALE